MDANNAYAHVYFATLLEILGRFPEAIAEIERARMLDPLSSFVESEHGRVLFRARRYNEAVRPYMRAMELDPHDFGLYMRLADVYEQTGSLQEALALNQQALRIQGAEPMKSARLARVSALLGRRAEALEILRKATGPESNPKWWVGVSLAYFALGDRDRGFEWLTKAFDQRQIVFLVGIDPRFDSVRSDLRFEALVRRLGPRVGCVTVADACRAARLRLNKSNAE